MKRLGGSRPALIGSPCRFRLLEADDAEFDDIAFRPGKAGAAID